MEKFKISIAYIIIIVSILLIILAFAILKFVLHEEIPNSIFVILGIATIFSPLIYYIANKKHTENKQNESKANRKIDLWPIVFYFAATIIILILTFFTSRSFFVPLLLTSLPMAAYFVYVAIRYKNNNR